MRADHIYSHTVGCPIRHEVTERDLREEETNIIRQKSLQTHWCRCLVSDVYSEYSETVLGLLLSLTGSNIWLKHDTKLPLTSLFLLDS